MDFRVKAALTQSLLEKTLKIRFTADSVRKEEKEGAAKKDEGQKEEAGPEEDQKKSRAGRIINLMSSDLDTIFSAWSTSPCSDSGEAVADVFCSSNIFMDLGSLPIVILFSLIFLYGLLGWSSIVGVTMMVITMIIPGMLVKLLAKIKRKTRLASDARIETMTETLNSVRIIKYFGLEKVFLSRIREKRENELWLSFFSMFCTLAFDTISGLLPIINMVCINYWLNGLWSMF